MEAGGFSMKFPDVGLPSPGGPPKTGTVPRKVLATLLTEQNCLLSTGRMMDLTNTGTLGVPPGSMALTV